MISPRILAGAAVLVTASMAGSVAWSDQQSMRNVFPKDLQWRTTQGDGLPAGAEIAMVHVDPQAGTLVYRLRLRAGMKLEPHHVEDELWFTVLQGNFAVGVGSNADWNATTEQQERSFFAIPAKLSFYGMAKTDVVLQIQPVSAR